MGVSNEKQREYRKKTGNAATKKYEKTPKGYLMRKYRNMQSRVDGIQKAKHHLYSHCNLLPREDFYSWALNCAEFWKLYDAWVESDFCRKLAPSVDRVDSALGYTLDNMEWITHSENSRRGSISRWGKVKA